ncbi:MAG: hypothetical protein M1417_01835 [Candidatus Thermoplasmatota archaeon]|nr:hypothetical protein [Candidatus Thermoplasmatota archaeon]
MDERRTDLRNKSGEQTVARENGNGQSGVRRNALFLSRMSALVFGILWAYDGFFKFWNNLYVYMPSAIQGAGVGQPA